MARTFVKTCLSPEEYQVFADLAHRNNVSVAEFMRSIIVDALADEGYEFIRQSVPNRFGIGRPRIETHVQRIGAQGRSEGREGSQVPRRTTS